MYTTNKKCPICQKLIYGSNSYKARVKKFCSWECFRVNNILIHKIRKFCKCGRLISGRTSYVIKRKKYCSVMCKKKYFRHSQEIIDRIRKKKIGRKIHSEKWKRVLTNQRDEKSPSWKGDKVGYWGLHLWVKKKLGRPLLCEHCKTITAKRFEWANKSGLYRRDKSDWLRLCTSCHRKYDNPQ